MPGVCGVVHALEMQSPCGKSRGRVRANAERAWRVADRASRECRCRLATRRDWLRRAAGTRCLIRGLDRSSGWTSARGLISFSPHVAAKPQLRRALSPVPLAGAGALQHRRRGLRPLGRARSAQACHRRGAGRRARAGDQLRLAARDLQPPRQCARARTASAAATASRSCCRRRPRSPRSTSRSTSSAASRCRSPCCSASTRLSYRLQNSGAKALITNAQGLAKLAADRRARRCLASAARPVDRRAGRGRARLCRDACARVGRFHARADRRRRSGA